MRVSFDEVEIGQTYTRPKLSELWDFAGYEALSRGIVTPRDTPYIILFITREKQQFLTQYEDRLENGILDIEGETNHAADDRLIKAAEKNEQVHLFYRDRHHMPFTYYGEIRLIRYERHTDSPSRFTFRVPSEHPDENLWTELLTHGQPNENFLPDEEGRRRIIQHVTYERSPRNRLRALQIHGNRCKACGFSLMTFMERNTPGDSSRFTTSSR